MKIAIHDHVTEALVESIRPTLKVTLGDPLGREATTVFRFSGRNRVRGGSPSEGGIRIVRFGLPRYPRDSARAAARIVAMALISNGRLKAVEAAVLDALQAHALLGLSRHEWCAVIHQLRVDLSRACRPPGLPFSWRTLVRLLDEVSDATMRRVVRSLSLAAILADRQVDSGEQMVLDALRRRWGIETQPHSAFGQIPYNSAGRAALGSSLTLA